MNALGASFKKLTGMKGIHYFVTRFGPTPLRKMGFDQKYISGQWKSFQGKPDVALAAVIEKYCGGGDILALGCGVAAVAGALNKPRFNSFHGVDLSEAAIEIARLNAGPQITFAVGDMLNYAFEKSRDVILLSESIYYIPKAQMEKQLAHLRSGLKRGGTVIVTIAEPVRYEWILNLIRASCAVTEDRIFEGSKRHLIVFK